MSHKNRQILYVDYRGARSEEDLLNLLQKANQIIEADKNMGLMCNYENGMMTRLFAEKIRFSSKRHSGKTALIGIKGLLGVTVEGINRLAGHDTVGLFDNEDEAKEWLVS